VPVGPKALHPDFILPKHQADDHAREQGARVPGGIHSWGGLSAEPL
jgi:hypothetical protein